MTGTAPTGFSAHPPAISPLGRNAPVLATSAVVKNLQGVPRLLRMALAMLQRIQWGSVTVRLPNGQALRFQGAEPGHDAEIEIRDYKAVRKLTAGGGIGFAEAFMEGLVATPDLARFLEVFARNKDMMMAALKNGRLGRAVYRLYHLLHANTKRGAKRNIHAHYDLGNAFYSLWLDPTMTYSSARFVGDTRDLAEAQTAKYRSLAEMMELRPEHHVLEIGSGWGGFAEFAARDIGCKVTGVTISREQLDFAQRRIARAGLSDRVEFRFQDYRDIDETFDRIASIEMFEAVGEAYWPAYFGKIHDALKPGGRAGLQIITIEEESFESYRRSTDFIQRYVFPGGMLPSHTALREQVAQAGLAWSSNVEFGLDYARTLNEWRRRFLDAWPKIEPMGFDARFRRLWEYYLAYCEAGFRSKNIDVTQIALARP